MNTVGEHTHRGAQSARPAHALGLGESDSVWFALIPLLKDRSGNPMRMLMRMTEKYGRAIPMQLKDRRVLFLSDVAHFRHVLVTHPDRYHKYFDGLRPVFGKSMITLDGPLWQRIRKPQQAAFHPKKFEEYLPYLLAALRAKVAAWREFARAGATIEMVEETWTLAADMICRALFDREMPFNPHFVFGWIKTYSDLQHQKAIRMARQNGALVAIDDVAAAKAMKGWAEMPEQVIAAPVIDRREETLLKMILEAEADPDFPEFDRQQVLDEIKLYLWAGTETTALTLTWCLYLLAQHPDVAAKIRAEVAAACGDDEPDWEAAQRLVYTRRVIQETMRLYPPVWAIMRKAVEADEIDGHRIAPGDNIVLCTYAVHHDARYWSAPEEFKPERFAPERMKARAKYSYLPFAAGRRSCIGGALSQLENSLALAMLLRRFEIEYVGEVPAPIAANLTLVPRGGLHFRIRELG